MSIIDRLTERFQRKQKEIVAKQTPYRPNRAERRARGFRGRFMPKAPTGFLPRYVRRHYFAGVPKTRRQRKALARCARILGVR